MDGPTKDLENSKAVVEQGQNCMDMNTTMQSVFQEKFLFPW